MPPQPSATAARPDDLRRAWALLAVAVLAEVAGSVALKAALDHPAWYAVVAVGYVVSFKLFEQILRSGMPLGVAYGAWGAAGVGLTAVLGAVFFAEPLTALSVLGLVLVVGGVVLVESGTHGGAHADQDGEGEAP
ncbi:SMR family transporter [Nocardioides sp. GY 10127]|uniref:DMT family transporter n=1 Tax=Nocardioides sp. GY 10127 TaxID=2569762 RepID=UPI0010A80A97|nr:SMR family transporter [Nocardioides sp. GY 10127]TIC82652.1 QacE family quaternary ammonium compound efflux SMR transporter [Nocardioides sp. GY 10127]